MVDVFEEVEEQLRSARYLTIVKKGWPWALGVCVAALAVTFAVWGWTAYQADRAAKASESYQQAIDAMSTGNKAMADPALARVASGPAGYRAIALMQQAGLRSSEGKTAEAVALFDQAAKLGTGPVLTDVAKLKAAYLVFDTASLAELETRLTPLTVAGRPYVSLAREALAMKRLASGHTAEARQALALIAISPDAGQALQTRAQIALEAIDAGHAPLLPQVVRAAAALTPAEVAAAKVAAANEAAQRQAAQQAQQAAQAANPQAQAPAGAQP